MFVVRRLWSKFGVPCGRACRPRTSSRVREPEEKKPGMRMAVPDYLARTRLVHETSVGRREALPVDPEVQAKYTGLVLVDVDERRSAPQH